MTTPPVNTKGFCLVAEPLVLTEASQALRSLHPATLTPEGPIQAQDHSTTRMFYGSDDLSGFAEFPLPTPSEHPVLKGPSTVRIPRPTSEILPSLFLPRAAPAARWLQQSDSPPA